MAQASRKPRKRQTSLQHCLSLKWSRTHVPRSNWPLPSSSHSLNTRQQGNTSTAREFKVSSPAPAAYIHVDDVPLALFSTRSSPSLSTRPGLSDLWGLTSCKSNLFPRGILPFLRFNEHPETSSRHIPGHRQMKFKQNASPPNILSDHDYLILSPQ